MFDSERRTAYGKYNERHLIMSDTVFKVCDVIIRSITVVIAVIRLHIDSKKAKKDDRRGTD